jgi:hypothetical protein
LYNDGRGITTWTDPSTPIFTTPLTIDLNSTSTGGSIILKQTGTGCPTVSYYSNNVTVDNWISGLDKYDASKFKISQSANLGTNDRLSISSTETRILNRLTIATSLGSPYTLPAADGTAGQYLRANGAGQLYFGPIDLLPTLTGLNISASNLNTSLINVEQLGGGASAIQFKKLIGAGPAAAYYIAGIDPADNKFKISTSNNIAVNPQLIIDGTNGVSFGRFSIGSGASAYAFPTSAGAVNQILKYNGAGQLVWANESGGGGGGPPFYVITDIQLNNTTTTGLLHVIQDGTGDASMYFKTPTAYYSVGIDASDSNAFKVSASNDVGTSPKLKITPTATTLSTTLTVSGYTLPLADGTVGQTIVTDGAGNLSFSSAPPPAGAVSLGGQAGPITFGTTDATSVGVLVNSTTQLNFTAPGYIEVGNAATSNSIFLNGGVAFKVRRDNTGAANLNLSENDYMLIVDNAGTTTVTLPLAASNAGRKYIVKRNYASGSDTALRLVANVADTIEGGADISIAAYNHVNVISDGINTWETL